MIRPVALKPALMRRPIDGQVARRRALHVISRALTYLVLLEVTYVFLYPILYMVSTSLKTTADLNDVTVYWIPRTLNWANYPVAMFALNYWQSVMNSVDTTLPAALGQVVVCSFVAYGFARIRFPGRDVLFFLVIFTFVVPPESILVPLYFVYLKLGWVNTYLPFLIPPWFGHGIRGALFVLIFRQFFRGLPWELEDAAFMDGAGRFRVYWQIMLPLAGPVILVVLLFSIVWNWNDSFLPMFLSDVNKLTLPARLSGILQTMWESMSHYGHEWDESLIMAATTLVILPQVILYIFAQRFFVESIDRTGLVE
jgi:multiple sugar transport system permease protein